MLADVRLIVTATEAKLVLRRDGETAEDEIWTFSRRVSRQEAADMAAAIFADAYDMMNFATHGEE